MQSRGYTLASNATGAANGAAVEIVGGKYGLVINATTYPSTCQFQIQGPSGAFAPVDAMNFTTDGLYVWDLPSGTYQLAMSGGTTAAVFAVLVSIPQ